MTTKTNKSTSEETTTLFIDTDTLTEMEFASLMQLHPLPLQEESHE